MTAPLWRQVRFEAGVTNWKGHVVPASLQKLLLADLAARGAVPMKDKDPYGSAIMTIRDSFFDPGGPVFTDAPRMDLALPGIKLGVRCGDAGWLLDAAQKAHLRLFDRHVRRVSYIKLHAMYHCFVMTPAHRDELVRQLRAGLDEVTARSQAFYVKKQHKLDQMDAGRGKDTVERIIGGQIKAALPKVRGRA